MLDDVVKHIDHIKEIAGIGCIAIGSDFGGILLGFAEGLDSVDDLQNLKEVLVSRGYTQEEVEKIFFKNARKEY